MKHASRVFFIQTIKTGSSCQRQTRWGCVCYENIEEESNTGSGKCEYKLSIVKQTLNVSNIPWCLATCSLLKTPLTEEKFIYLMVCIFMKWETPLDVLHQEVLANYCIVNCKLSTLIYHMVIGCHTNLLWLIFLPFLKYLMIHEEQCWKAASFLVVVFVVFTTWVNYTFCMCRWASVKVNIKYHSPLNSQWDRIIIIKQLFTQGQWKWWIFMCT